MFWQNRAAKKNFGKPPVLVEVAEISTASDADILEKAECEIGTG